MESYKQQIERNLNDLYKFVQSFPWKESTPWKDIYSNRIRGLLDQLHKPSVLTIAIAGKVKAGKSSLLNALLEQDLAPVGELPTTATINTFYYGKPDDPNKPILCLYRNPTDNPDEYQNGKWMSLDELKRLQTTDTDVLRETLNISEMRYYLDNEQLKEMTLVDTPGIHALISEHVDTANDWFKIYDTPERRQLANQRLEQNNNQTIARSSSADAVLFVTSTVATEDTKNFLDSFKGNTSPRNAIGIISRIDRSQDILKNRNQLAQQMGSLLKDQINTAIPVSAALARTLQKLDSDSVWQDIFDCVHQFESEDLEFCLMMGPNEWGSVDAPEYPVSAQKRKALSDKIDRWETFALIAREMAKADSCSSCIKELWDISGFPKLKQLLKTHFLKRKQILYGYKIVKEILGILQEIRMKRLNEFRTEFAKSQKELNEMKQYLMKVPADNTPTRSKIFLILEKAFPEDNSEELENRIREIQLSVEGTFDQLKIYNKRFEGLLLLEKNSDVVTSEERDELNILFGCYSAEETNSLCKTDLSQRKEYWRDQRQSAARGSVRRDIADLAMRCYDDEQKRQIAD